MQTAAVNGSVLTLSFDEPVTGTLTGWALTGPSGAIALSNLTGSGTGIWQADLASPALSTDSLLIDYDSGTGNAVDGSSNALGTITDRLVTNNTGGSGGGSTSLLESGFIF